MALRGTEPRRASDVLKHHDPVYSLEERIVASGSGKIEIGQVLGLVRSGTASAVAKAGGNTGNGTISAVTVSGRAKAGTYSVRFTGATAFDLSDPGGDVVASGATGVAVADDLGFTITVGGTAFVAGDGFDIAVVPTGKKAKPYAPAAADGSQIAAEIAIGACDATLADAKVVTVARKAVVVRNELVFAGGVTTDQKAVAVEHLEKAGILSAQGA
ncbi:head decoration protein [Bosea sp. TWI1241]|uniref:head decoration protein n=1 Tax=Bosea sp. TWI1241 TaxID=3148904 RepID=UPI00320A7CC4